MDNLARPCQAVCSPGAILLAAILAAPAEAVLLSFAPLEAADQAGQVKIVFRHGMPPFGPGRVRLEKVLLQLRHTLPSTGFRLPIPSP